MEVEARVFACLLLGSLLGETFAGYYWNGVYYYDDDDVQTTEAPREECHGCWCSPCGIEDIRNHGYLGCKCEAPPAWCRILSLKCDFHCLCDANYGLLRMNGMWMSTTTDDGYVNIDSYDASQIETPYVEEALKF